MAENSNTISKGNKISFTSEEFEKIAQSLIFSKDKYRENVIIPRLLGPVHIKTREENAIETAFESCAFKSLMSCVIGKVSQNSQVKHTLKHIY